jgi:transposase
VPFTPKSTFSIVSKSSPVCHAPWMRTKNSRLLLTVEGRSAEALKAFATALLEHGGDPSQIEEIAIDMSPAYVKGATEYFPGARIVFDKFHVMVLAGAALDQVRYELQREGAALHVD